MGYESKLYVVERLESEPYRQGEKPHVFGMVICEYDLSKMGGKDFNPEFYAAFKKETDYSVPDLNGRSTYEDAYGKRVKSAKPRELADALKKCEARQHYKYIPPLIAMLEYIADADDLGNFEVVHYGY